MNYKEKLSDYLKSEPNRRYCLPIVKRMLQANFRKGQFVITITKTRERIAVAPDEIEGKTQEILEFIVRKALVEGYNSLVIPCMISKEQAPNFYVNKESPREEELWQFLYLLLTGVHSYDYILNLENAPEEIVKSFREWLTNKNYIILTSERSGLNIGEILASLSIPKGVPFDEFIIGFLFLSCFAKFWKDKWQEQKLSEELNKAAIVIPEDISLVIYVLSRQKKKLYIFPRLKETLMSYYEDFFTNEDLIPSISKFVFSLYIADKDYKEKSAKLLNKFLYYLFEGHINGELLSDAIELKTSYGLKKKDKRIYGFLSASKFFLNISKLTSSQE